MYEYYPHTVDDGAYSGGTPRYRHSPPFIVLTLSPPSRDKKVLKNRIDEHMSWKIASYSNNTEDNFRKRKENRELFR